MLLDFYNIFYFFIIFLYIFFILSDIFNFKSTKNALLKFQAFTETTFQTFFFFLPSCRLSLLYYFRNK